MIRAVTLFVAFHLIVIGTLLALDQAYFLLNFELAFFISGLIIFLSFRGYQKFVETSVDKNTQFFAQDAIEKIEDPYDLYDEEENGEYFDFKKEKKRVKQESLKKAVKSSAGHFSFGRIGSYVLLILSFLVLKNNAVLDIAGFLSGITFGIAAAVYLGIKLSRD